MSTTERTTYRTCPLCEATCGVAKPVQIRLKRQRMNQADFLHYRPGAFIVAADEWRQIRHSATAADVQHHAAKTMFHHGWKCKCPGRISR